MITQDREYRAFGFTASDGEDMIIEGYAAVFNEPSFRMVDPRLGQFTEIITETAFDKTDMSNVVLVFNHDGKPLARTKNGTLDLTVDQRGLKIRADLSGTQYGQDTFAEIKKDYMDKMSFAFKTRKPEGERYEKRSRTRYVTDIEKVFDVSLVTMPAYEQTEVYARSYFEAEAEKEMAEARALEIETENKRKRIKLLLEV